MLGGLHGLHVAQLMPLPLAVSCFSKIQIGFTFMVTAHPGNSGQSPEGHEMDVCVWLLRCEESKCGLLLWSLAYTTACTPV